MIKKSFEKLNLTSMKYIFLFLSITLSATLFGQSIPSHFPSDGLVGWYPFSGNSLDQSGNNNHSTYNSASLGTDRFGNFNSTYAFNGVSSKITLPPIVGINKQLTISVWIYNTGLKHSTSDHQSIFLRQGSNFTKTWLLKWNDSSNLRAYTENSSYTNYNSDKTLLGHWYHLAAVFNDSSASIYVDGNLVNTNLMSKPMSWTTDSIYLGYSGNTGNQSYGFFGKIDDVAIWNRALTSNDIGSIYSNSLPCTNSASSGIPNYVSTSDLIAWYPFNSNSQDESGNSRHSTFNSASLSTDRNANCNSAYEFNGINSKITLPPVDTNTVQNEFTVSMWIENFGTKLPNSNHQSIFLRQGSNFSKTWLLKLNDSSSLRAYTENSSYTNYASPTNLMSDWYNLTATFKDSVAKLYIDGNLVKSESLKSPFAWTSDSIFIGFSGNTGNQDYAFLGKIDDIGMWSKALSNEELEGLFTGVPQCTHIDTVLLAVTDTLYIDISLTSISPIQFEHIIKVYPNPTNDILNLALPNNILSEGYSYTVTNLNGQIIESGNLDQSQITLNVSTWGGTALYLLNISDAQGTLIDVKKIVLQ